MSHLHYSPFQYATGVEFSTEQVNGAKIEKVLKAITKPDRKRSHAICSTMSCEEAAAIPGTPQAFISPNPIGAMKDVTMPVPPVGVARAPAAPVDHSYRERGRVGYGDRGSKRSKLQEDLIKSPGYLA
jgi:hypothetical protein